MNTEISRDIRLVSLDIRDAGEMFRLIEENREDLGRYLSWVAAVKDIPSTEAFIDERINSGIAGAQWFKVIFQGSLCGMFGIKSVTSDGVAEVGYCLAAAVQGKGIIATTIVAMSPYFETEIGARILEFRCLDANQASINIALRAGAELTQIIPGFMTLNGTSHNLNVYRVRLNKG